jgi:hypothetical protein
LTRNTSQLRVSFLVDSRGLVTGFSKASRETDKFGRSTQRSSRATAALGSTLRRAAIAAGGAAAAYLSITQAKAAITTTQELALTTAGLNRNLGLATKEASRWAAVTRARGVDSKTLVMSFTSLSRAIDGVKTGSEAARRPFESLGITQKDLTSTGGDFQKQILLVADALGEAEGSAGRQAAAAKLLGRGYRDILPLFYDGAEGLREQLKWADEFGAAMGKDTVSAMMDFTTAQRRGRVAVMGLQIAFAKFATPAITEAINGLGDLAAILNSPGLTKTEKVARLQEEFGRLQHRILAVLTDLAPLVANAAGEIGFALARGIGRAFTEANLFGKVAVAALLVRMFGGPKALIAGGAAIGTYVNTGIAASMAKGGAMNYFAATFGTARGFGRSFATSTGVAAVGAAQVAALSFGKALLRFLPPVFALLSVGEIVGSLLAGDMKSAGIKAGGALLGGIAGFLLGGPVGALIGVGIGTFGADLGRKLIEGFGGGVERESVTVAERIAASTERLTASAAREDQAYKRLGQASDYATRSRDRQRAATDRVRVAEAKLAVARRTFGPDSEQAIQAERRLARAKDGVVAATQRVKAANRLEGAERKAAMSVAESTVRLTKTELRQLQRRRDAIAAAINQATRRGASDKRIAELGRRQLRLDVAAERARKRLNESYRKASREIGPEFASSLRKITGFSAAVSKSLRQLEKPTIEVARNSQTSFERTQNYLGDMARAFQRRTGRINKNMGSMPNVQTRATDRMIEDLRNKIGVIGDLGSPRLNRRGGGRITGSTKSVVAAVSPGELISYGSHEIIVPGRPEPRDSVLMNLPVGAKVFTHDGQMRMAMGASPAQALRDQAPHFAAGGIVRPQVYGGSPMANSAANKGVGVIHARAQKKYENNMVSDLDGAVRLASRFGLRVSSGYRAGDDGYHGINRARDFAGSASRMYSFANFIGTRFGSRLLELIYSPLGWSIKNGSRTAPYAVKDHFDHVHVAMRTGGVVGALGGQSFRGGGRVIPGKIPQVRNLPAEPQRRLFRTKKLTPEDALLIYDQAETLSASTETGLDDEAVRVGRIYIQKIIRSAAQKKFDRQNRQLDNLNVERWRKVLRNKKASKKAKAKARRKLAEAERLRSGRSESLGTISGAESEIASLEGSGSESGAELAEALEELTKAIKEQNELQSSVQATSSREALRMLSDVLSGQIVGKRLPVNSTPTGVRY